jgi:hypothetical protein
MSVHCLATGFRLGPRPLQHVDFFDDALLFEWFRAR